jgi:hypothetical protein
MVESSISSLSKPVIDRLGIRARQTMSHEPVIEDPLRGGSTGVEVEPENDAWESGLRFRDASVASSSCAELSRGRSEERVDGAQLVFKSAASVYLTTHFFHPLDIHCLLVAY